MLISLIQNFRPNNPNAHNAANDPESRHEHPARSSNPIDNHRLKSPNNLPHLPAHDDPPRREKHDHSDPYSNATGQRDSDFVCTDHDDAEDSFPNDECFCALTGDWNDVGWWNGGRASPTPDPNVAHQFNAESNPRGPEHPNRSADEPNDHQSLQPELTRQPSNDQRLHDHNGNRTTAICGHRAPSKSSYFGLHEYGGECPEYTAVHRRATETWDCC
jgi:hypothetical protein